MANIRAEMQKALANRLKNAEENKKKEEVYKVHWGTYKSKKIGTGKWTCCGKKGKNAQGCKEKRMSPKAAKTLGLKSVKQEEEEQKKMRDDTFRTLNVMGLGGRRTRKRRRKTRKRRKSRRKRRKKRTRRRR